MRSSDEEVMKGSFTIKMTRKDGNFSDHVPLPMPGEGGPIRRRRQDKEVYIPPVYIEKGLEDRYTDGLETLTNLQRVMQHRPEIKDML